MRARKGWAAVFAALVMTAVQAANLSVTDVKIAQRYPWNGLVDITYTVNCDDPNKDVWVYPVGYDADKDTSVALMPENLTGEGVNGAVKNGTHRMTWDMAKQMGKDYNRAAFSVTLHAYCDAAPYMVIDLSAGSEAEKYPVSYLSEIPEGGWTDEPYKTTKMVFRLILPGKAGNATLTKPYYFALFPITERQWCLIDGGTSTSTAWKREVSYDMMRGTVLGSKWPMHQQVDATSFVGKMRLRTGMTIDLSTYAQWYRAASAGGQHQEVVKPNAWDIHAIGSVGEWCLDWGEMGYFQGLPSGIDPVGPKAHGNAARIVCGRDYYTSSFPIAMLGGTTVSTASNGYATSYYWFTADCTMARYNRSDQGGWTEGLCARLVALPVCK